LEVWLGKDHDLATLRSLIVDGDDRFGDAKSPTPWRSRLRAEPQGFQSVRDPLVARSIEAGRESRSSA
jgi:hypothetical protein